MKPDSYYLLDGKHYNSEVPGAVEVADSPQLAKMLNTNTKQMYAWDRRRAVNGFPEPVSQKAYGSRPGTAPKARWLWAVADVLEWHKNYVPKKGGSYDRTRDAGTGRYVASKK